MTSLSRAYSGAILFLLFAAPAEAGSRPVIGTCRAPGEVGNWTNDDADFGDLTKVEITYRCPDADRPNGVFVVRAKAKCMPRNCTWGFVIGRYNKDGAVVARFVTYAARRTVILKRGLGRLDCDLLVNFHHPDKVDFKRRYVLVRGD